MQTSKRIDSSTTLVSAVVIKVCDVFRRLVSISFPETISRNFLLDKKETPCEVEAVKRNPNGKAHYAKYVSR